MQRTDMHRLQELVRLFRLGSGAKEAATLLKMSPNTERKYREALLAAGLLAGDVVDLPDLERLQLVISEALPAKPVPQQVSSVESWADKITTMVEAGAEPTAIYDRLRLEEEGFEGSLSAIKRMCARLKRARGPRPEDVVIPVETTCCFPVCFTGAVPG